MVEKVTDEDVEFVLSSYTAGERIKDFPNFSALVKRLNVIMEGKNGKLNLRYSSLSERLVITTCVGSRCQLVNVVNVSHENVVKLYKEVFDN